MDTEISSKNMAASTPRRSSRIPHIHTPKLTERKKSLFHSEEAQRESLTKHRKLPVVDSESDGEECDLGIISTLDSSSDENDNPKTPEKTQWHETRSQTRKLREIHDLKSFMKSPFTLKKYQNRYSCPETRCGSISTPVTPHLQNHPGTPSSTHSCTSVQTNSSTSSRARKSLASLIADTESCSSSLKDLNFDSDSGTDSKENTPSKSARRNRAKLTPKINTFKGILLEQKRNSPITAGISPMKNAVVCLTKMDFGSLISPTQIQKTPQNTTGVESPPKLSHRRSVIVAESPESQCESDKSYKRLRNESVSEAPVTKYPRLDVPKARLSLFNSDRLKEILSTKSFYGKPNPEINPVVTTKLSNAIEVTTNHHRKHSTNKRKRKPGQINLGVRHRIKKPKHRNKMMKYNNGNSSRSAMNSTLNSTMNTTLSSTMNSTLSAAKDTSLVGQNSSQDLGNDKHDLFDKEKQTIEALLSQWEEEDVPETEMIYSNKKELPCFSSTVMEETHQILQPVTAVQVTSVTMPQDCETVLVELGVKATSLPAPLSDTMKIPQIGMTSTQNDLTTAQSDLTKNVTTEHDVVMAELDSHESTHGTAKTGQFLPVEGGYILVEEAEIPGQEELPDLDEIERELRMLDEQILNMAKTNNIDAKAVLASTETGLQVDDGATKVNPSDKSKLFPIFSKPNPGPNTTTSKGDKSKKTLIKTGTDQYVIDAGQKKFGATQCAGCGTIYQIGDPQDEHDHLVHHNATDVLRFNGWKEECVIERGESWRCIRVRGGDTNWKRVETLLRRVIHPQLGWEGELANTHVHSMTAYLYIEKKQIAGCLIAETKTKAYKFIPGEPDCCSIEDYPVKCGISRIWTHLNHRRRGVARRLLDCARASFLYGDAMRVQEVSFSAPTAAGKAFATKYSGTENFYVYLD